jgi:hypothetical protein
LAYYELSPNAFSSRYLLKLRGAIQSSPYFAVNNLNRDFIGTKGFSIVFQRTALAEVARQFPWAQSYLERALRPECNAFYLNPLQLKQGSRVDPHIDRSLRSYCKTVNPPMVVSVLYVQVSPGLKGGELVLRNHRQQVGKITPQENMLVVFQGDLTHSVNAVESVGDDPLGELRSNRLSLVCEQYSLEDDELLDIPEFTIESRAVSAKRYSGKA